MARPSAQLIADIDAFRPADGNWRQLDELLHELWRSGESQRYISALLAVFERFPEGDGAEVLWTIVHGLESLPGYEPELVRSVQRRPSEMGVIMIGRLLNAGTPSVNDVSLVDLLRNVAAASAVADRIRKLAGRMADKHSEA